MRVAHKMALLLVVIVLLLLTLLLPRTGHANQSETFGDIVVRYSAISTDQLFADAAQRYGIARSPHNGLVNIAIERKTPGAEPTMIAASVSGRVADLTGHAQPIAFRETDEDGAIDYLGEFPLEASGTYVFTIDVRPPGAAHPYTVKFNRDYVAD
jgi:hypothetical protein